MEIENKRILHQGTGEMAQWLKAQDALPEDLRVESQHPHDSSQLSVTQVPEDSMSFSGPLSTRHTRGNKHTYKQNTIHVKLN